MQAGINHRLYAQVFECDAARAWERMVVGAKGISISRVVVEPLASTRVTGLALCASHLIDPVNHPLYLNALQIDTLGYIEDLARELAYMAEVSRLPSMKASLETVAREAAATLAQLMPSLH